MDVKLSLRKFIVGLIFVTIAASTTSTSQNGDAKERQSNVQIARIRRDIGGNWRPGVHNLPGSNGGPRILLGNRPLVIGSQRVPNTGNGPRLFGNNQRPFGSGGNHLRPLGNGWPHQGNHMGNGGLPGGNHRPPLGGPVNHNIHNVGQHGGQSIHTDKQTTISPFTDRKSTPPKTPTVDIPSGLGNLRESYMSWWREFQSGLGECGKGHVIAQRANNRVVGGVFATIEEWPWMVSLYSELIKQPWCAGTLIADNWVVTAAHCFNGPFGNPSFWTLHFGKVNSSGAAKYQREQNRTIEQVFLNPDYNELARTFAFDGDIALIKLNKPVDFTDTTSPICLARIPTNLASQELLCKITGYGISNLTNVQQGLNVLHVASVPLLNRRACAALDGYGDKVTDNMICAGRAEGGVDTCKGDSGGPLQCRIDGKWSLVGVTSWGGRTYKECAQPAQPGVYTDVAKYTDWIYTHIYLQSIRPHN